MYNTKSKFINWLSPVMMSILLLAATPVAANVGKIIYGYGDNYALDTDGNRRNLKKGAEIREGDTLVTSHGRMHVRLIDGGFVSVYPNSEYKINQFKYSGKQYNTTPAKSEKQLSAGKEDRGLFSLLKGAARQVTGLLGRTYNDNFKFKTSVATIGIRGTGFFAQICQADCFDADGNPMQDGMYVKNNTGIISMTTDVGDVSLAQGQSAFAASRADSPQQTTQPPVAYHLVTPDHDQLDFDEKIVDFVDTIGSVSDVASISEIDGIPVGEPIAIIKDTVLIKNLTAVTSIGTLLPIPPGDGDTSTGFVVQNGNEIASFQTSTDEGFLVFDKAGATLKDSGSDLKLGVLWNRWSSGYTLSLDGSDITALDTESGTDVHLIGSDNLTPDFAGLQAAGRGTVTYINTGGTNPTLTGAAGSLTGTQSINATINIDTVKVTNFQLDVAFGSSGSFNVDAVAPTYLTASGGNSLVLAGTCSGTMCGAFGGAVLGKASINLVGPKAEGIYGAYNLTNLNNAVSGSYLATDTASQ